MDEDGELDEDWRRWGASEMDRDWGLAGIWERHHWPSDADRRGIGEACREDRSFVGEGEDSMSMTGKAAVKREDAEAEAVTRAAGGGERDEGREKPSQMRGWTGTRRRYPFYRVWGE